MATFHVMPIKCYPFIYPNIFECNISIFFWIADRQLDFCKTASVSYQHLVAWRVSLQGEFFSGDETVYETENGRESLIRR